MRRLLAFALVVAGCRQSIELFPSGTCNGAGAAVTLAGERQACAAATAAATHRFALCSCRDLSLARLTTASFDSTGASGPLDSTSIGSDGNVDVGGDEDNVLDGALYSGGNVTISEQLEAAASLRAAGTTTVATGSEVQIAGDAYCGGDASGPLHVAGTLHIPAAATVGSGVVAQATVREAVTVAPPCDCAQGAPVDVAAAVAAAAARNADATIGLDARAATPDAIDLPCGVFYVASLRPAAALVLRVHGRSELAVAGDAILPGALDVQLDAGAALDLVVGGALQVTSASVIGSAGAPARVRLWIGGGVQLAAGATLGGVVTAPSATVQAAGALTIDGSLFADGLAGAVPLTLRYDRATLSEGSECGAAAQPYAQ